MSEWEIVAFSAAMGFVVAGAVSTLYQLVTAETADFLVTRKTAAGNVLAVVLSMFGGPFIVARKVIMGVRGRTLGPIPALIGLTISGMWSTCAGIFFINLLIAS